MDANTKKTWSLVHKDARLEFQILALVTLFKFSVSISVSPGTL